MNRTISLNGSTLKYQIKNRIWYVLFTPVENDLDAQLDTIATKNCQLQGLSHKSFLYKGVRFNADTTGPPLRSNKLAPSLKPEMEDYLSKVNECRDYEENLITGYITMVLNLCKHPRDCLRLLPSGLHAHIESLLIGCTESDLNEETVQEVLKKNQKPLQMIKERMALNLLLR